MHEANVWAMAVEKFVQDAGKVSSVSYYVVFNQAHKLSRSLGAGQGNHNLSYTLVTIP